MFRIFQKRIANSIDETEEFINLFIYLFIYLSSLALVNNISNQ